MRIYRFLSPLLLLVILLLASPLPILAAPPVSAQQLVKEMVYNELQDREHDSFWSYRVVRTTPEQTIVACQVETGNGPLYRILSRNGVTLAGEQLAQENTRLDKLFGSPSALAHNRAQHRDDEQRLQRLMKLMPDAFLYDYEGASDEPAIRISFRPNPAFVPQTWEARVYHGLAGTVLVDRRYKRLIDINGKLVDRIDFGYGILGHIEKGGTFEVRREKVTETHWKTSLVNIQVDGRVILFKTVSKQQREERSGFLPVPTDISLERTRQILDQALTSGSACFAQGGSPVHK
ncbi:MAG: hypothetical protein HIU93_07035 [Acidobacteria bacterium]|nr:hypothetical protein [Acidobacteriota bacterium]MBW4045722.1 hypothetical protein [Acidobacteriota bacterium]